MSVWVKTRIAGSELVPKVQEKGQTGDTPPACLQLSCPRLLQSGLGYLEPGRAGTPQGSGRTPPCPLHVPVGAGTRSRVRNLPAGPETPTQSRNVRLGISQGSPAGARSSLPSLPHLLPISREGFLWRLGLEEKQKGKNVWISWISVLLPREMSWDPDRSPALTQA